MAASQGSKEQEMFFTCRAYVTMKFTADSEKEAGEHADAVLDTLRLSTEEDFDELPFQASLEGIPLLERGAIEVDES